jgi:hypothetical protein
MDDSSKPELVDVAKENYVLQFVRRMMGTLSLTIMPSVEELSIADSEVEVPSPRKALKKGRVSDLRQAGRSNTRANSPGLASKLSSPFLLRYGTAGDGNKENLASGSGSLKDNAGGERRRSTRLAPLPPLVERINVTATSAIPPDSLSDLCKKTFGYGKGLGLKDRKVRAAK